MLKLVFIVIVILLGCFDLDSRSSVHGDVVEVSNIDKRVQFGIVCKMCKSAASMSLVIMRNEFLWRAFFKIMSPTCYLMPNGNYREVCDYMLSGELARMVTLYFNEMNATTFCYDVSMCGNPNGSEAFYENDEELEMLYTKFIHEKIDVICTNYATDIKHCAETLKKISSNLFNNFLEFINKDEVDDML